MDAAFEEAVVGIVVGIVTAALLFALKAFWSAVVDPALRSLLYRGVDVSGQWIGRVVDDDGTFTELTCHLTQQAHVVNGVWTIQFTSSEKAFDLHFEVTGYIWEGYVTLNLRPKDRKITSYATSLLKISGGGVALVGMILYRNVEPDLVDQIPVTLLRQDPSAARRDHHIAVQKRLNPVLSPATNPQPEAGTSEAPQSLAVDPETPGVAVEEPAESDTGGPKA